MLAAPNSKKAKLATGVLAFEEAFPCVCNDPNCIPKPRDMILKSGMGLHIKTYGLGIIPV